MASSQESEYRAGRSVRGEAGSRTADGGSIGMLAMRKCQSVRGAVGYWKAHSPTVGKQVRGALSSMQDDREPVADLRSGGKWAGEGQSVRRVAGDQKANSHLVGKLPRVVWSVRRVIGSWVVEDQPGEKQA
ncbi:hypothetical protein chiPu_0014930 [Chiloscyllium punctatum]|uniref:Uncharacterized protein n=1 Tax=Chiloscyllium punctatum TaxID=137246 RepID=A0A401T1A6_CHIPU|nr:hypothetical protein [Chiloscyllium punctatum]